MDKDCIFKAELQPAAEDFNFFNGNFMSLTLAYSTFVFILNILTIILVFK